jgi:predicted permease
MMGAPVPAPAKPRKIGPLDRCPILTGAEAVEGQKDMRFEIVLNQVLILFLILLVGYVGARVGILDTPAIRKMSEILLYITSPLLVFKSFFFTFSVERLANAGWVVAISLVFFLLSTLISRLIYAPFPEKVNPVMRFTAIFSNCGYMGLPMLKALFGDDGVFYGSFYIVMFHMVLWTVGIRIFGVGGTAGGWKKVFLNPAIIAVYCGMVVFLLQIPVPDVVKGAAQAVGDMTMPLSMLIIGAVISTAKPKEIFNDPKVYLTSAVRLIAMPLLALLLTRLLHIPHMPAAILVTALAMPAAANITIFSEMFGKDSIFASKCVSVSTLLSILTVPVILSLIGN